MLDKFRILLIVITMSMFLTACHNAKFRPSRSHSTHSAPFLMHFHGIF